MLNEMVQKQTLVAILIGLGTGAAMAAEMPAEIDAAGEDVREIAPAEPDAGVFDDWRLVCGETGCRVQTQVLATDGTEVLRVEAEGAPAELRFVTALGLHLPDGLAAGIGADTVRELAWRTCGPETGCLAEVPLDGEMLAAMRRERSGTATLTLVEGVPVRLGYSLMGFSAAWRALAEARAQ